MLRYLAILLVLAVWIYAFIDCLNTPEKEVRKLPKVVWVIIILLFGQALLLGPVAWFAVGRPRRNAPYGATRPDERRWVAPDDNPDFLKSLGTGSGAESDPPAASGGPGSGAADGSDAEPDSAPPAGADPAPRPGGPADPVDPPDDEKLFRQWEADLRRGDDGDGGGRTGSGPDTPPKG